ncbi:MAG TPA: hypothetical protein VGA61_00495 [Anaerolineae bacterium]
MLNETVITQAEVKLQTWSLQSLLRFIGVLALLFALGCLYFSQVNAVASIRNETTDLRRTAQVLERENVSLMVQVAAWTRPSNVQAKAVDIGLVAERDPVYVTLPTSSAPTGQTHPAAGVVAWWQQMVAVLASYWPVH